MHLPDVTSAVPLKLFGKEKPIKVLQKNAKFNAMFVRVGDNWEVPGDIFSDVEKLTCA